MREAPTDTSTMGKEAPLARISYNVVCLSQTYDLLHKCPPGYSTYDLYRAVVSVS